VIYINIFQKWCYYFAQILNNRLEMHVFNQATLAVTVSLFLAQMGHAELNPADELLLRQQQQEALQRQQQRDEQLQRQFESTSKVNLGLEEQLQSKTAKNFLQSGSEAPCFEIKQVVLQGELSDQFKFALKTIEKGENSIIGRCLGVQGLNQALDLVQNKIISRGFVTTRVLLPQQNIASGQVILTVIPGRVDQIQFAEGTSKRAHQFNSLPVKSGDVLNVRDIEQGLENFKRVPTVEADFKIKPSEHNAMPGYSDLMLAWQQSRPYRLHLGIDDTGSKSTGKYQGTATLSLDHLLTLNDLFYVSYNHDLGGGDSGKRGTDGYYMSYSIPFGYWLLSSSYSNSNYYQTVAGSEQNYDYSGESQLINLDLSRVLYRDAQRKTTATVGGWYRTSRNYIEDVEVEVQRRKTSGWKASLDHTEYLSNATLNANVTYKRGTAAFNAIAAPEERHGEAFSRVGILQANASLQVPFRVGQQSLQYLAEWRMQSSHQALTPQDRFSIGNRYTVRGFDGEQNLIGDQGFLVRNELSGSIMSKPHQWYAGIDYAEVGGRSTREPNPLVGTQLMGGVVGLRGQLIKGVSYDVFVGAPIDKPKHFITDDVTTGFSLNWSY